MARSRSKPRRRRGRLLLVIGGASSGKSTVALALASRGLLRRQPKAFVATAQALDLEMAAKIRRHQSSRDGSWTTADVPIDMVGWFQKHGPSYKAIVVDCMTLWLSNLIGQGWRNEAVLELTNELLSVIRATPTRVVLVTNELGLGLVPAEAQGRRFRDLAGEVNQLIATQAAEVHGVVSGIPLRMK